MTVYKGRPLDLSGRLEKEIRAYDFLDRLEIAYERVDHPAAVTEDTAVIPVNLVNAVPGDTVKVMLWEDLNSLLPLSPVLECSIQKGN